MRLYKDRSAGSRRSPGRPATDERGQLPGEERARLADSARALLERLSLLLRGRPLQRIGVAFTSAMMLLTVATHPWAGATPAQAAAAFPASASGQAVVATVNQSSERATEFTADISRSADSSTPTPDISTPEKFIAAVVPAAQDSQRETGVPAAVTIAQAILESEWGRSSLSTRAQNYFGIKAASGPGPAGVVAMPTREVFNGRSVTVVDGFKAYHNLYESVMDHGRFLAGNPRYADAFKTSDPKLFAQRIAKAGYATDPDYSAKVSYLIDRYHLDQYDLG